jgi:hypothetical protein
MKKLVLRAKLVAEFGDKAAETEVEVARIERDEFTVPETLGLSLAECREPSWRENMELRSKKAIEWVLPQLLLRRSLQRQHARAEKFWPSSAIHRSFESF